MNKIFEYKAICINRTKGCYDVYNNPEPDENTYYLEIGTVLDINLHSTKFCKSDEFKPSDKICPYLRKDFIFIKRKIVDEQIDNDELDKLLEEEV